MKTRTLMTLWLAAAGTFHSPAMAGEAVPGITVTAPFLGGVPQEWSAGAATGITAQDIEDRRIGRIEDALELVPGVTVSGRRGFGQNRTVMLRGLRPRNTRVFIDGVEMSDPSQAQYALGGLNMADVERIEVLRGPRPGRFGPDTAGGVVSIVTKRPTEPFTGEVGAEYGRYGTKRAHASVGGVQGAVDYRLSASGTHSLGYSDFNEDRGGVADDPYRQWSGAVMLGVQATENLRFDAVGRYQREDVFYDSPTADTDWNRDQSERLLRLSATLRTLGGDLVHQFGISDTLTTQQYWGQGTAGDTSDGARTRIDYVADWALSGRLNLQAGADATHERMEQYMPGFAPAAPSMESDYRRLGAFATLGVTPLDGLDLAATLRGDDHDEFGAKATWRLGAAYTVEATGTTLRGSYGTAWQAPSLYERFDPCNGAADLKPESSRGWDVGIDQDWFAGRASTSITYFHVRAEDEIVWRFVPPRTAGCDGGIYANLDETEVRGVEAEMTVRPLPTFEARLSYTWQNAMDAQAGVRLRDRPVHQATSFLSWQPVPEALLSLALHYRDATESWGGSGDEFWTADLGVRYAVSPALTVHARIENLLDRDYEAEYGFGTPGRSAYAGATVRF
jgi:vitamin B12 transporter